MRSTTSTKLRVLADRDRLLHGPYTPPPVRRGDHATCLYRDSDVIITSWSDARISWPRCRRVGERGGYGLLVDADLARAVRCESSLALQYWFGVHRVTIWEWRKALGVQRFNEGSERLRHELNRENGAAVKGKRLTIDQCERRRRTAIERNLVRFLRPGYHGRWWTKKELRLLGKLPDDEVAERTGRPVNGVRVKRTKLGIPSARDRRQRVENRQKVVPC